MGNLKTPTREQASHYHSNASCFQAACPTFVPSSLVIPADIKNMLNSNHIEFLRLMFGVNV